MFAGFMPMALPRDRAAKKGLCGLAQVQLHSSPDFHQRVSQLAHHYFIMGGPRREAQALGTARNGGEVDRLYINAIFSEQDVADAFGLHWIANHQWHDVRGDRKSTRLNSSH